MGIGDTCDEGYFSLEREILWGNCGVSVVMNGK
jgi:hypothetical protein